MSFGREVLLNPGFLITDAVPVLDEISINNESG